MYNSAMNKTDNLIQARVIAEHKGVYKVKSADREYLAKITGRQIFHATSRQDYPAVGDWVEISVLNDEQSVIQKILPRKTIIKRMAIDKNDAQIIATNIDVSFIVESVDRDFNLNRFERYVTLCRDGGVTPTIVFNKIDLISKDELAERLDQINNRFAGVDVISTSTKTDEGLSELLNYIQKEKTYCFLGSSGVGKSTLINKLLGEEALETRDIGLKTGRGKHSTTSREMFFLKNGGIVIDNPGMREVGMTDTNAGISAVFDEIAVLAANCEYNDCSHVSEPDCAVLNAVRDGKLDAEKYNNYISLKKEADYYEMSEVEKRKKDRQFGKFLKKAKKDLDML
jgi:ribosome biogenesis GTPase